jgi:predicted membrane-bound spermidine synthase
MMLESGAAHPQLDENPKRIAIEVAAVAGLILFVELALIRYIAAYVRVFGFYVNFVLIATFLGMGTGMLRRRNVEQLLWVGVPALMMLIGLVAFLAIAPIDVPTHPSEYIWGYVSAANVPRHVSINTAVIALFVLTTVLFIPLGALLGSLFSKLPPLSAYSADLVGSLVGVGAFAAMSFFRSEPPTWFGLAFLVWILLVWRRRPLVFAMAASAAVSISIVHWTRETAHEYWSPYYRITVSPREIPGLVEVDVNGALHQVMVDFEHAGRFEISQKIRMAYERPYRMIGRIDTALVVGAGTGNDIAVLLRLGAKYIDAVEIDPVIAGIGQIAHPQKPYDDPRVHLTVTDARAFLRAPPRRYDVITFGTLDSQSLLSGMSAVRLDNFVYTMESFRTARAALKPSGSIVLYHLSGYEYIGARLYQLLQHAFDAAPRVIKEDDYLFNHTFIAGAGALGAERASVDAVLNSPVELSTDDWPFPYLQGRGLPQHYVAALVAVLLVGLLLVGFSAGTSALRAPNWSMFLIGVGFLLLETKGITAMSLLFGSTWTVNVSVIASILCVALLGAVLTARHRAPRVMTCLIALTVLLAIAALLPPSLLVTAAPGLRWAIAATYIGLPVLFATMIFSQTFAAQESPTSALAFNTLGGVAGGVLEYASMVVGISALNWFAIVAYASAVALLLLKARGMAESGSMARAGQKAF